MSQKRFSALSLIPYLEPVGSRLCLRISKCSEDPSVLEEVSEPFMEITESGPFTRLVEARFSIDSGNDIKKVFLLLQRDECRFDKDELRPVNNRDLEKFWQKTFLFYSRKSHGGSLFVLPEQVNEGGGLMPFQPLFFCKLRQIYFTPLCPECGFSLQQCWDDDLLISSGFAPYSTSLRRYLHCPSCLNFAGKTDFYVISKKNIDPPSLKNKKDLIRGFGKIKGAKNHQGRFPCAECANSQICYGADDLAVSRIVPFSFYPFFMLVFEAMSISAVDFLSLISGASLDDLESRLARKQEHGRIKCLKNLTEKSAQRTRYFFDSKEKHFLEVLYLKLSFLRELVQIITSGPDRSEYPAFRPALDRVWVKLPKQGALLPYYWDFKVNIIDLGEMETGAPFSPESHQNYGVHYLGLVWFFAFLVNKKQGVSDLYNAIRNAAKEIDSNSDSALKGFMGKQDNPAFYPENIFWNPENINNKPLNSDLKLLWEESLALGWSLLETGRGRDLAWSRERFWLKLNRLRERIKDKLFQKVHPFGQAESAKKNGEIHQILTRIAEKWRSDLNVKQDEGEGTVCSAKNVHDVLPAGSDDTEPNEGDVYKTVILSSEKMKKETVFSGHMEDVLEETFIVPEKKETIPWNFKNETPDDVQGSQVVEGQWGETSFSGKADENDIPETVIISSRNTLMGDTGQKKMDASFSRDEGQDLEETMIIKKGKGIPDGNDLLAKTTVLSSDDRKGRK